MSHRSTPASQHVVIGIIGDFNPDSPTHAGTNAALRHVAHALGIEVEARWLPTPSLEVDSPEADAALAACDGLWCAPGSPYRSFHGALNGIRYAREHDIPFIGTCGGFQHAVIEYARNVLGFVDAQHAENDPYASTLFITALACSLYGMTMQVQIVPGSATHAIYGTTEATENYFCSFGLAPEHRPDLEAGSVFVAGIDQDDEVRIIELPGKRFYIATLFVPQMASTEERPHPLIRAYVAAAAEYAAQRVSAHAAPASR
jgi:CTP synthase (UTP-ammonia lyase)